MPRSASVRTASRSGSQIIAPYLEDNSHRPDRDNRTVRSGQRSCGGYRSPHPVIQLGSASRRSNAGDECVSTMSDR